MNSLRRTYLRLTGDSWTPEMIVSSFTILMGLYRTVRQAFHLPGNIADESLSLSVVLLLMGVFQFLTSAERTHVCWRFRLSMAMTVFWVLVGAHALEQNPTQFLPWFSLLEVVWNTIITLALEREQHERAATTDEILKEAEERNTVPR